jgi:hypothetical protein
MFDIFRFYISACSNSVQLVALHPIFMSILFHHYKQLTEFISEVEQIESEINKREDSQMKKNKKKEAALPPSPDRPRQLKLSEF